MKNKPIKRNEYMKQLSRDHHFGLLFCWKIKEGLKRNIELERLKGYMNFFREGHLKTHFQEEEILLFDKVNDPLCDKAKNEHKLLADLMDKIDISDNQEAEAYRYLTEILNDHIRFEERILFPHLEAVLSAETLSAIGDFLAKEPETSFKDNYADEFWINKKQE